MSETPKQRRQRVLASQAPAWAVSVGSAKARAKAQRAYRESKLGKLGAASAVRRIDPKTGAVIEIIEAKGKG